MAQRVEYCDACTEQRRSFVRREIVGHGRNRLGRGHYVFCVTTVEADSGNFLELAENEMASTAEVALKTVSAMPADSHPLSGFPLRNVSPDRIDAPGDFMAWERAGIATRGSLTALRWRRCGRRHRLQP
jgi:hypothetical protein